MNTPNSVDSKITPQVLFDQFLQMREDLIYLPANKRDAPIDNTTGRLLEQMVRDASEFGVGGAFTSMRFAGAARPSFADVYLLLGQLLFAMKRTHPTLHVNESG